MLQINLSKQSGKFLEKLPAKQKRQIAEKIFLLANNPIANDSKKLHGFEEYLRSDVGECRIVYRFSQSILYVDIVGKRNDGEVYRKLKRRR